MARPIRIATKKEADAIEQTIRQRFIAYDWTRYYERNPKHKATDEDTFKEIVFKYNGTEVVFPLTKKQYLRWRAIKPKILND